MAIPSLLRDLVILRSGNCCEYCRLSQLGQEATFHVDHVVPVAAQGKTEAENLALACVSCSLHKAAKQVANDPDTGEDVPLFNPRRQSWSEHFRWEGVRVVGLSPTGRATVVALRMNRPGILSIREEEILLGRHPVG
jgi:HNH endonuclease